MFLDQLDFVPEQLLQFGHGIVIHFHFHRERMCGCRFIVEIVVLPEVRMGQRFEHIDAFARIEGQKTLEQIERGLVRVGIDSSERLLGARR